MLDYHPWARKLRSLLRGEPIDPAAPPQPAILRRSYKLAADCPACGGGSILRTQRTGPLGVCEGCAKTLIVFVDGRVREPAPHSCGCYASDPQCTEARQLRIIVRERNATAAALARPPAFRPIDCGAESPIVQSADLARVCRDFEASLGEPTPDWLVSCLGCDRKILAVRTPWPPRGWSGLVYWDPSFPLRRRCDSLVPFGERGRQPWGALLGGMHECRS